MLQLVVLIPPPGFRVFNPKKRQKDIGKSKCILILILFTKVQTVKAGSVFMELTICRNESALALGQPCGISVGCTNYFAFVVINNIRCHTCQFCNLRSKTGHFNLFISVTSGNVIHHVGEGTGR